MDLLIVQDFKPPKTTATQYPSNIFFEDVDTRPVFSQDVANNQPDIESLHYGAPAFNYRMNYRVATSSKGASDKLFYGSSLMTPKKVPAISKEEDQRLFEEEIAHVSTVSQPSLFDVQEFHLPPEIMAIADSPYIFPVYDLYVKDYKDVLTNRVIEHKMSPRSRNKVKDKIYSMYRANPRTHFFITLTFISQVKDQDAVKVLNKFLTVLRTDYGGKFNYIWIAERQNGEKSKRDEPTGNIHFHCVFDKRFDVQLINRLWVLQQYNSGITHHKYEKAFIEKCYSENKGSYQIKYYLNPVDAVKVNGVRGLSSYLTKYVTKNEDSFHCRVWHCSRTVSSLFTAVNCGRAIYDSVADPRVNSLYNPKTGKTFVTKTIVVRQTKKIRCKSTGKYTFVETGDCAVVHTIVNKRHYLQYMDLLEEINKKILQNTFQYSPTQFTISPENQIIFSNF
jgi:hypothetical protein